MKKYKLSSLLMYAFVLLFVAFPLIYILVLSFMTRDEVWGVVYKFTLDNYKMLAEPAYLKTFADSLKLALISTVITAIIGYPFGYFTSKLPEKQKNIVILLITVQLWTNALIRLYGWIILLRNNGIINSALIMLGYTGDFKVLYTYGAIILGMVYSLLPFMILPVFSSSEKLDPSLVEASRDLGADALKAFFTVTFKLTLPGLLSGVVLVFVPSMGLFFISDLLGGGKIMLVGNLIQNQLLTAKNQPFGAALSVTLIIIMALSIMIYTKVTKSDLEGIV